jgi:alkylhydroperoxidase family enzyme
VVRVPPAPLEGPDADEGAVRHIEALRGGRISTLYRTLLHSGPVAAGWCELGTAIRWSSSLDDRLRELLTCQTARLADAAYEWQAHAPLAEAAGVTPAQLASLPDWQDEPTFDVRDRAALAFVDAVLAGTVTDELFDATAEHFDRRGIVELAATASYYLAISRFLDACGVHDPA